MDLAKRIENRIKEMVKSAKNTRDYREPLVGFASAHDHLFTQMKSVIGPHHLHPREMFPEGQTVVAFFLPFAEEIVRENQRSKEVPASWANVYVETNRLIGEISAALKQSVLCEKLPHGLPCRG